jgi:hypothetical protein
MSAPTLAVRIGPGALPIQNSRNPALMPARASSFAFRGIAPRSRHTRSAGPKRGWEHRQECADKTEGDEDKAENKINATHQPQPSCKSEGLSFQPRPSRASDPNCPARVTAQVTGHVYATSTGKFLLRA